MVRPDSAFFTFVVRLSFGLKRPRKPILGYELSGEVEKVSKDVSLFSPGDLVHGSTTGLRTGAYAEYVCLPEEWNKGVVAKKPSNITHGEAATVPTGGMAALHILRKADIRRGQRVLIYGASGCVGTYAVQLAKHMGAEVTGVCSGRNQELVRSLGADDVIDYTKEDIAKEGQVYDVVFDAVGKISKKTGRRALRKGGTYLSTNSLTAETTEKMAYLGKLLDTGEIKAFIDRTYPLEEAAEAHRYADTGHKRGNVVITIDHS